MYDLALIITNLLYIFASNKKWIIAQILNLLDLVETESNRKIIQEIRERSSKQFRLKKSPREIGANLQKNHKTGNHGKIFRQKRNNEY